MHSGTKNVLPKDSSQPRKRAVVISESSGHLSAHAAFIFDHHKLSTAKKVTCWKKYDVMVLIVPKPTARRSTEDFMKIVVKARNANPQLFICVIDMRASESAVFRSNCVRYGANMVTSDSISLRQVLNTIGSRGDSGAGHFSCPYCQMPNLTEDELWQHVPLYHVNEAQTGPIQCPLCEEVKHKHFLKHLRNHHGPVARGEEAPDNRAGIVTHTFALVVVRRPSDNKFLVVQEACNSGFWLPGGRVTVGETLLEAAVRETKEEAGIEVSIKGLLKIEHSSYVFDEEHRAYNRMRVLFYAEPVDDKELPKSVPDYDSAGATFISVDELDHIKLRAEEPRHWFERLTADLYYTPLDILSCWKHNHRSEDYAQQRKQRKVISSLKDQLIATQKEAKNMRKQLEMEQKVKEEVDNGIPESFLCPITRRVMRDPVIAFDGRSYERQAIEEYLKQHNKSPITGAKAVTMMVFPNNELSSRIIAFIEAQEMASEEEQSKEGEGETILVG